MSYCRFSSEFFECDVYVYADVSGGWTTHVAARKIKHAVPTEIHELGKTDYWAAHVKYDEWRESLPCDEHPCNYYDPTTKQTRPGTMKMVKDSEYVEFEGRPHAGETYNDSTPGDCADRLEEIRKDGYRVPQYAIDALREEQAEMNSETV